MEILFKDYGTQGIDCHGNKWERIPIGKCQNITGQEFNRLTALFPVKELDKEGNRPTAWLCQCECGNTTITRASSLKNGHTKSCGCKKSDCIEYIDMTGQVFNRVTILERYKIPGMSTNNKTLWKCHCSCGNDFITSRHNLITGSTQSCGCLKKERTHEATFKDLTGLRVGRLTVIKQSDRPCGNWDRYWYCNCDCGAKNVEIVGSSLRQGTTLSCGCLRSKGEFKISQILSENNISFEKEYTPNFTMITGGYPHFDFAILNKNGSIAYLIEYQGEQHYMEQPRGFFNQQNLDDIKIRDKEKKQYCEDNNIPLIYINYKQYKTLSLQDLYFPDLIH